MLRTAFLLFFYIVTLCVKAGTYKIPKITITSPYVKQMIEFAVSHAQECYPQCCNLTILPQDYSIIIQEMSPYFQVTFLTEEYLDLFDPFVGYTTCDNYKIYITHSIGSEYFFINDEEFISREQPDTIEYKPPLFDTPSYRFKINNDSLFWVDPPVIKF